MSVRLLLSPLTDITNFLFWQQRFAFIEGYLADMEGYALMLLAAGGPGIGEVVEIGSYLGRSTAFLAAGARDAGREKVNAVDHFRGSMEHQAGQPNESRVLLAEGTTYRRFLENLTRAEVLSQVNPIVAASEEAARSWSKPIRLLFIDGDHSYAASKRDFDLWSPFVVEKGVVCFHDINMWPGVTQLYREVMSASGTYQELATICSMKVIQKRG